MIRGDLRNCVLCNSKYSEGDPERGVAANLPRVLYCGDSLCENCITKQIQRASITDRVNYQNVAACQVVCPVCEGTKYALRDGAYYCIICQVFDRLCL